MNKIRAFYVKHPKFRQGLNIVEVYVNNLNLLSWIVMGALISTVVFILYCMLSDELQKPITTIVGFILTSIAIPLLLDNNKKRYEQKCEHYEKCSEFYKELVNCILHVLQCKTDNLTDALRALSDCVSENYAFMCLNCTASFLRSVTDLKDECDCYSIKEGKFSMDSFRFFSENCIQEIRKEGNIKGKFSFNGVLLNTNCAKTTEVAKNEHTSKTTNRPDPVW